MPARPTWKGYLKISLVNIPIKVFPATDAGATLSFNQLHGECQTRIQQKRWCPKCEREVPNTDIVKGFEFEKGRYVVVDEEDIEKVRVDSTRVINLEKFTDDTAIDPIYLERPYYLAPDGAVAREAFAVIREGMKGKAGIGKVALYGREYLVKVQPREKGLVMYTLRHANEIRSMDAIDELSDMPAKVKPEEVKLAHQVMGTFEGTVDLQEYRDDYQVGLPRDHRRQDRGARDRRAGGRGAAKGGQPDGGAAQEPRYDQREQEAGSDGVADGGFSEEACWGSGLAVRGAVGLGAGGLGLAR
jgi:DNA end-binding protein Ku